MLLVVAVLVVDFVVDLLYLALDPRLREGRMSRAGRPPDARCRRPPVSRGRRRRLRRPAASSSAACSSGWSSLMALLSFVWTPYDPTLVDADGRGCATSSAQHWLGTDKFGRDVLSQIIVGARTTLFVGFVAVGVAAVIGVPLGILAAMAPRWSASC